MPPKQKKLKDSASAGSEITDPRFANFATDPRFRLPSKKYARTKLDKRFSKLLTDEDFTRGPKVDRYGRKLKDDGSKKKALQRLYEAEENSEDDEEEEAEGDGEVKVEMEVENDDVVEKELKRAENYDPARMGGFSSSEDEDSDEEEDGGVEIEDDVEEFPDMQAEAAAVEMGDVSTRIAVVNLDWDNINSTDLFVVFSSFVKPGGSIQKITVYPSDFGLERMEREELEGPPKEIFAKQHEENEEEEEDSEDEDEDEDDEEMEENIKKDLLKEDNGQDFDGAALRTYQLERLRYYYAVVVCSDNDSAQAIYEACDGSEYLSSANFFDLRFVPDGVEFENKPRDECTGVPSGYKPREFVTDALQHSKVKLTWDTNPEENQRKDAINKAFTGSRAQLGENDLQAYLGSDSESDDDEVVPAEAVAETPKLSKRELARQAMRAALGLPDEPIKSSKSDKGPVGDMEVTFTAGLSSTGDKNSTFVNDPIEATETTAERYIRLEKERKARRKEKAKAKREGRDPDAQGEESEAEAKEDMGFDDPFFETDVAMKEKAKKDVKKEARLKKKEARAAEQAEKESHRAELELLMTSNASEGPTNIDHFDMNEILRAEKAKKKSRSKYRKETGNKGGLQENFEIDTEDPRFSKVFESHEFAIDPSNPKFKKTEGMQKLLEEGRRKRDTGEDGEDRGDNIKRRRQR